MGHYGKGFQFKNQRVDGVVREAEKAGELASEQKMAAALLPASPQTFFAKSGSVTLSLAGAAEQMAKDMCRQYLTFVELQTCLCLAM